LTCCEANPALYIEAHGGANKKAKATLPRSRTARTDALNGLLLATFWQRLLGFAIDFLLAAIVWVPIEVAWRYYVLHQSKIDLNWDFHEPTRPPSCSCTSLCSL